MSWQRPSDRICHLVADGVRRAAEDGEVAKLIEAIEADIGRDPLLAADPALLAIVQRANRSNFAHWMQSVLADPGTPVSANTAADVVASVRELVRRGYDEAITDTWMAGQGVALRRMIRTAFTLTEDRHELAEVVDYGTRLIVDYGRATVAANATMVRAERDQLTGGARALRLQTVMLVLDGAPIATKRATSRLGYDLDGNHLAAIAWTDSGEADALDEFDESADALAAATGGGRPLLIHSTAASRWIWLPAPRPPDPADVARNVGNLAHVRWAFGIPGTGVSGFRRTHQDALATQALMMRTADAPRVASWAEVRVAAMIGNGDIPTHEFLLQTLGSFVGADTELRETVRVYLREQSSAPRAARVLHTHRNTVLTRVARAERFLPRPLAESALDVAVALEYLRWNPT